MPKKGYKQTKNHKQEVKDYRSSRLKDPIVRKRISDGLMGHSCSIETRKKISDAKKKYVFTEEHCENISKSLKEFYSDPIEVEKMAARVRKRMWDPDVREKYTKENHPMWKGGTSFEPYCEKFDLERKRAVRKFFNYYCLACGKHETENLTKRGQYALSVHHVDHDKEQGCNGKPFNLVPLCVTCHMIEIQKEDEYKKYINKTLEEGFKWGIWSREQYEKDVMY